MIAQLPPACLFFSQVPDTNLRNSGPGKDSCWILVRSPASSFYQLGFKNCDVFECKRVGRLPGSGNQRRRMPWAKKRGGERNGRVERSFGRSANEGLRAALSAFTPGADEVGGKALTGKRTAAVWMVPLLAAPASAVQENPPPGWQQPIG